MCVSRDGVARAGQGRRSESVHRACASTNPGGLVSAKTDDFDRELSKRQAGFFKALAHPKRVGLLRALMDGEKSVMELMKLIGATQSNTSQHLAVMRRFGLIQARRSGSNVYYSIGDRRIVDACELVRVCVSERMPKTSVVLASVV